MKENNYLIAEFMGMYLGQDGWFDYEGVLGDNKCYIDLKFHESWDWLMPVVEKIEEDEEIDVNILLNGTIIFKWRTDTDIVNNVAQISFDKKIEHVYDAVVNFIKRNTDTEKMMKMRIADMDNDLN